MFARIPRQNLIYEGSGIYGHFAIGPDIHGLAAQLRKIYGAHGVVCVGEPKFWVEDFSLNASRRFSSQQAFC